MGNQNCWDSVPSPLRDSTGAESLGFLENLDVVRVEADCKV